MAACVILLSSLLFLLVYFAGVFIHRVVHACCHIVFCPSRCMRKVQLILKWFLGSSISSKRQTNKFNFTSMIPQVDLFSFVFWRKSMTPKNNFEIKWPLEMPHYWRFPGLSCRYDSLEKKVAPFYSELIVLSLPKPVFWSETTLHKSHCFCNRER